MQAHIHHAHQPSEHLSHRFRNARRDDTITTSSGMPEHRGRTGGREQRERTESFETITSSKSGQMNADADDDSWLNDTHIVPRHLPSTAPRHTVPYEDLPTMTLAATRRHVPLPERRYRGTTFRDTPVDADATQRLSTAHMIRTSQVIYPTTHKSNKPNAAKNTLFNRDSTKISPCELAQTHHHGGQHDDTADDPIKPLLENAHISSITALGPERIYVELCERCGVNGRTRQVRETPYHYQSEQHMMHSIERLLHSAGRSLPTSWSLSDVRLPDGSLLSVSLPPGSAQGPTFTIRKPGTSLYTLTDLVREGMLDMAMAQHLRAYMRARHNICLCGPAESGKMLLLNALCAEITDDERIVTIEEMSEQRTLSLRQPQVIALQTQQERIGEDIVANGMTMRNVLSHALHMDAQRIIVGHCHGNDAPALLRAMYDGCEGIVMAIHATDVRDCLSRLEVLCLVDYLKSGSPTQATPTMHALIRAQIAASLHVVVSMSPGGKVKEVVAMPYAQSLQNRA